MSARVVVVESFEMAEIHDALKQSAQAPFIITRIALSTYLGRYVPRFTCTAQQRVIPWNLTCQH